jgi:hypothetical protein
MFDRIKIVGGENEEHKSDKSLEEDDEDDDLDDINQSMFIDDNKIS